MMIIDEKSIDQMPDAWPVGVERPVKPKITTKIEPGNDRKRLRLNKQTVLEERSAVGMTATKEDLEDWSMSDMLVMTTAILESNTVYRSTLALNVRAFYQAVKNEEEMHSILQKLEDMETKDKEMADRMTHMEEILLSLGADPKKGEKDVG